MKALLLAAGRGTRLRPLTELVPKCMLPVAGKPTLVRAVEWLRGWGVTELAINLHHVPERVIDRLGDGRALGVSIRYSYEAELRGTAGATDACRAWIGDEPFLVVYADNVIGCDLDALERLHVRHGATLTLALHWREDVTASGIAEVADGDRVVSFVEKPRSGGGGWVSAGLLRCEPRVLDAVPHGRFSDFGTDVLPGLLAAGEPIGGYRMGAHEFLYWIDTPADLARVDRLLRSREAA
jgi:NDP-sugar pyrophosphorylase family protein